MIKLPRKEDFPKFHLTSDQYDKLIEWMASRLPHQDDAAVNGSARWEYRIIDHGVFFEKFVIDRATNESYEIDSGDPANW